MIVGGFVYYKSSMKNLLIPENEPLTEDEKKEIIQKVTEKTTGSHMIITFE
ncbi:MAG: Imm74 family immunity protein [Spirochaetales bacterium]|nr:Imm74 family immunity protein [Spirochaetales bacterium]